MFKNQSVVHKTKVLLTNYTHRVYMKHIVLSKKDIISLNQHFHDGTILNEGSLDYAISLARKTTNWSKSLAYLVRSILLDNVFEEGNKRTTALLILTYSSMLGYDITDKKISTLIKSVVLLKIIDLRKIEEMIKGVTE
jgi:hypothetical protein